jgi:hypothetical protein
MDDQPELSVQEHTLRAKLVEDPKEAALEILKQGLVGAAMLISEAAQGLSEPGTNQVQTAKWLLDRYIFTPTGQTADDPFNKQFQQITKRLQKQFDNEGAEDA